MSLEMCFHSILFGWRRLCGIYVCDRNIQATPALAHWTQRRTMRRKRDAQDIRAIKLYRLLFFIFYFVFSSVSSKSTFFPSPVDEREGEATCSVRDVPYQTAISFRCSLLSLNDMFFSLKCLQYALHNTYIRIRFCSLCRCQNARMYAVLSHFHLCACVCVWLRRYCCTQYTYYF